MPSHCSPKSTTLLPQLPPHWQLAWQFPGQLASSVPSHCSLGWFTWLSPQVGHWQFGRQAPGHALSFGGSHVSPLFSTPLPHWAPLRKIATGCRSAPGPGRPVTPLIAPALTGGMQNVAARTEFCVPGVPLRTIGSRKQLRRPPVQTWFGLQVPQLPLGGGLQSVSDAQPRKLSVLQN